MAPRPQQAKAADDGKVSLLPSLHPGIHSGDKPRRKDLDSCLTRFIGWVHTVYLGNGSALHHGMTSALVQGKESQWVASPPKALDAGSAAVKAESVEVTPSLFASLWCCPEVRRLCEDRGLSVLASVPLRACLLVLHALHLPAQAPPNPSPLASLLPDLISRLGQDQGTATGPCPPPLLALTDLICHITTSPRHHLEDCLCALVEVDERLSPTSPSSRLAVAVILMHRGHAFGPSVHLKPRRFIQRLLVGRPSLLSWLLSLRASGPAQSDYLHSLLVQWGLSDHLPTTMTGGEGEERLPWHGWRGCSRLVDELAQHWPRASVGIKAYLTQEDCCLALCTGGHFTRHGPRPPVDEEPPPPVKPLALADPVSVFSHELLLHLFFFLSPKRLAKASMVCRSWAAAAQDWRLWRVQYLRRWPKTQCASSFLLNLASSSSNTTCPRHCPQPCSHCRGCGGVIGVLPTSLPSPSVEAMTMSGLELGGAKVQCLSDIGPGTSWREAFLRRKDALRRGRGPKGLALCEVAGCTATIRNKPALKEVREQWGASFYSLEDGCS